MSDPAEAPGGFSLAEFKSTSLDVGEWLWGTVQGAFNEKQSISQMVVDAVIGMIPVVGDVTAARDLIAVVIGLCEDPRKRESKFQWMLLVVLICALIPVFGGVIKGVGRIMLHTMAEIAHIAEASARTARMLELARDMVAAANRLSLHGNAEKWLKDLSFARYQDEIMQHLNGLLVRIDGVLGAVQRKVGWLVPEGLAKRITSIKDGLARLKALIADHIPEAIKQLDRDLHELQAFIHSGGETTSKAVSHAAASGAKNLSYTEELILLEGKGATRTLRGGLAQNGSKADEIGQWYKHEPGFPDLTSYAAPAKGGKPTYPLVATYAGQIINREIEPGEKISRVFGEGGKTHLEKIDASLAAGSPARIGGPSFWGLGEAPSTAERWREGSAVLDEWNHDGFVVIGEVLPGRPAPMRGCTGVTAEQHGDKIAIQYLRGGDKQAMIEIPADVAKRLNELGAQVQATGSAVKVELWGVSWELKPTGWPDANGIHGYLHMPGPGTVQTVRLGAEELASKRDQQGSN